MAYQRINLLREAKRAAAGKKTRAPEWLILTLIADSYLKMLKRERA